MRYFRPFGSVFLVALALSGCREEEAPPVLVGLPPAPLLSERGYGLILDFEVGGGRGYYERFLARPTWPGAASGVTVGVGYDCGYNAPAVIREDWRALSASPRLVGVSGLKGVAAKARVAEVRDIVVAWELAEGVFNAVTVTRFWQLCERTYPGFAALHPNAQAALVSLTFNRGASMVGDRRREMREIRDAAARADYGAMARANRASVRIWRGTAIERGMARRREAEAKLMEEVPGL